MPNIFPLVCNRFSNIIVTEKQLQHEKIEFNVNLCNKKEDNFECYEGIENQLRYYRLKKGISLKELADKLGVHRTTVTDWEKNKCSVPHKKIFEYASVLDVNVYELFDEYHLFVEECDKIIKSFCENNNIKYSEFAKMCNVNKVTLYSWLKKEKQPNYKNWAVLKSIINP